MSFTISFADIISGIIAGLVCSFTLSFLIWKSVPKIKISKYIAEEDGKFRCKIQNNSKRDIGDTIIHVTYRTTKDGSFTYTKNCPILYSKKNSKDGAYNEFCMRIRNAVWNNKTELSVSDFYSLIKNDNCCCIELEISYYDYNLFYGSVKRFIIQRFTYDSIVFNSYFPIGSLKPIPIIKNPDNNSY